MIHLKGLSRAPRGRAGFTLIELLITISIIAMMASMVLYALSSAQETAREAKTKAIIAKLDSIIKAKWESYRTRRVPINTSGMQPTAAAKMRLDGLRELMRMELPDRWSDIAYKDAMTNQWVAAVSTSNPPIPTPSVSQGYFRRFQAALKTNPNYPTGQFQSAECLYLIVFAGASEDFDPREMFSAGDIKDTDGDGIPEFIDGWGTPISFLRWAPGLLSELQVLASGIVASANPSGQTVTFTSTSPGLSTVAGAYVGGAVIITTDSNGNATTNINAAQVTTQIARITGYQVTGGTATFTCSTAGVVSVNNVNTVPPYRGTTMQNPFNGNSVRVGDTFVVTAPDPFDPNGMYPMYAANSESLPSPDTSAPSFALYPLIYSAGPDKITDVAELFQQGHLYSENTIKNNPFFAMQDPSYCAFRIGPFGKQVDVDSSTGASPGNNTSNWLDNIHNHMLNAK